jgi:hypothetical protein
VAAVTGFKPSNLGLYVVSYHFAVAAGQHSSKLFERQIKKDFKHFFLVKSHFAWSIIVVILRGKKKELLIAKKNLFGWIFNLGPV